MEGGLARELTAEQLPTSGSITTQVTVADRLNPEDLDTLSEEELFTKVENILLEKIKAGDQQAVFQLGQFYFEQDLFEKAKKYFERIKDKDLQAAYQLATILYDGLGSPADQNEAFALMKRVSEEADSKKQKTLKLAAAFNVGRAFFQGYGVKQSDEETERWWLMAADDGNPKGSIKAQTALGLFYSREDSLDLKQAFFWHSEACGNGSLESQGALGVMYKYGLGTKCNMNSAFECLREAAERGNVYAMGHLVEYYYNRKLHTKAADLAIKVASLEDVRQIAKDTECLPSFISKGIAMSAFLYARCLHQGHGVKLNKAEAKKFYSRAYDFDADICARLQHVTQHGGI